MQRYWRKLPGILVQLKVDGFPVTFREESIPVTGQSLLVRDTVANNIRIDFAWYGICSLSRFIPARNGRLYEKNVWDELR